MKKNAYIGKRFGDVSLCVPTPYGYGGGALSPSRFDRPSHGLWSLWEMLKLHAERFVGLLQFTAQMDMALSAVTIKDDATWAGIRVSCDRAAETCEDMGLFMSAKPLRRLVIICRADATGWPDEHRACFRDAVARVRDELSTVTLLELDPKEGAYFDPTAPLFGSDFVAKFPSDGVFELEEAAKCFALARSTACVFHLMRIMEVGIRAVARCLGIPDPMRATDRNWGNILREIKNDLDPHGGQAPTKTWNVAGDKEFFESAYASLDAVRVAWRNTTMHVENKYTPEEAEHILGAVKGFMNRLASRCDENGDPKA